MPTKNQTEKLHDLWSKHYEMNDKQECLFNLIIDMNNEFEKFLKMNKSWELITKIALEQKVNLKLFLYPKGFTNLIESLQNNQESMSDLYALY